MFMKYKHLPKKWSYLLAEALLIVFSVLFALFVNNEYQEYGLGLKKERALKSIEREIRDNGELLEDWLDRHQRIQGKLSVLMASDSLLDQLFRSKDINRYLFSDGSNLYNKPLSSTTWESCITTGIVSEFDIETVKQLTNIYNSQQDVTTKIIDKITEVIFGASYDNRETLGKTLQQLAFLLAELLSQEEFLRENIRQYFISDNQQESQ